MLVPHVAGLEGIGLRLHLEDHIDDVLEVNLHRCRRIIPNRDLGRLRRSFSGMVTFLVGH